MRINVCIVFGNNLFIIKMFIMKETYKITQETLKKIISEEIYKILKKGKTSYGLKYSILSPNDLNKFDGYDRIVAQTHIQNFGVIIVDGQYGDPIDNEYDLEEIVTELEKKGII